MNEPGFRQVHLDFHTAGAIPAVAADFDADRFAETLARAQVDSVTCFARCHHGWLYYPSEKFPERIHPQLQAKDLLGAQIAACHRQGIRVPVYITVQWDHFTAEAHPDWCMEDGTGRIMGTPPFEPGFYRNLCVNSPYFDFLKAHTREVLERYPVDGLFFDIVMAHPDASGWSRREMLGQGLDPASEADRWRHGVEVIHRFTAEMTAFVRQFNSDCTVFYNAGHIGPGFRHNAAAYTHIEIESLPGGDWGYLHFPATVRYARTLGLPMLGMTGKFHTWWGDFSSFKNEAALEFECFHALAHNAAVSVGDQLHPSGRLCEATYELIGGVFEQVKAKEPWCRGAASVAEVAVFTPEAFCEGMARTNLPDSLFGAVRLLQEGRVQFDIVDLEQALEAYRLVILPDEIPVAAALAEKLEAYVRAGGALLVTGRAGLNPEGTAFALDCLGVEYGGPAEFSPDFILPRDPAEFGLRAAACVMYDRGTAVVARDGTDVLAEIERPYFNRTWQHFCSHQHTPSSGERTGPGMVQHGRCIYLTHPVFTTYRKKAPHWCKAMVLGAVRRLLPDPVLEVSGPSGLIATLSELPGGNRVVHLLYYVPERRAKELEVIEETLPLRGIELILRSARPVKAVQWVPQREPLAFEQQKDGTVKTVLPEWAGHAMVEFCFDGPGGVS